MMLSSCLVERCNAGSGKDILGKRCVVKESLMSDLLRCGARICLTQVLTCSLDIFVWSSNFKAGFKKAPSIRCDVFGEWC